VSREDEGNPLDQPASEETTALGYAIWHSLVWGGAGLIATACIGGFGVFPGLVYGWREGTRRARKEFEGLRKLHGEPTTRHLLVDSPDEIATRDAAYAATQTQPKKTARPNLRSDPLYRAMRQLEFSHQEAADAVGRSPPGPELSERLRRALRQP